jgi:hypothetical protein
MRFRGLGLALSVCLVALGGDLVNAALAEARAEAPGWEVTSTTYPSVLRPGGGKGDIGINVFNIGSRSSQGPVAVTDLLPEGVVATEAGDRQVASEESINEDGLWNCSPAPTSTVTCVNSETLIPSLPIPQSSPYGPEEIGVIARLVVAVKVLTGELGALVNRVIVAGGGAPEPASTQAPITIGNAPAPFGLQNLDGWAGSAGGTSEQQAGSHPYDMTFSFDLNTAHANGEKGNIRPANGQPRNISVNLPPGLIGNPTAVPECTRQEFDESECPPPTQVGIDTAYQAAYGVSTITPSPVAIPVYNLVPPPGIPAEFGFNLLGVQAFVDARVRSGGDSGITGVVRGAPEKYVSGNRITFWGEPADPDHDGERYSEIGGLHGPCIGGCTTYGARVPFFTLPTGCSGQPQEYTATVSAWEDASSGEASFLSHDNSFTPSGITGCDHLSFTPSISNAPDTGNADTPAGLTVEVKVPQEGLVSPEGLAMSDINATTVTLPQGLVINPGQAVGLQACQQGPIEESSPGDVLHPGRDNLPLAGENGEEERFDGPPDCPNASKVGTVQISTPLLKEDLEGDVYVLESNPPSLKLLAAASGEGVNIKLVLNVSLNEQTGQITTRVVNIPEAPVTDFKLAFSGGAQAALDTPTECGEYSTSTDFTPWSTPAVPDASPSSSFAIDSGAGGAGCPSSTLPFAPSLTAGSTTDQAGGFSDFSLLLQRPDDQQRISGLQFKFPPGLTGELSHIPLCTNAQAESNTCPEASKIGHTVVESGPGPYPLVVPEPGQDPAAMYLTESYEGAPFGLSIVVPLHVGPFTLPTQRVRAKIEVDPRTAQLTVKTNPLPQEVAGVPTDLREIDAVADHPEFIVNPTNCEPSSFSGTATGAPPPGAGGPNASASISSHFQVGSCRSLGFSPSLAANSSGKTSKAKGASLSATLSYPATPPGTGQATDQANIHSVKVELPKQLPSRLTTLQKACTAAQFNLNPAGCPAASDVGQAVVHTPVLPVPLVGPAYFVSHGGEAFPQLVVVLQGYGVEIIVEATTFISKASVTSLTFKTAPDAPFSSFTLSSPEGPDSILTANGNLCTSKLTMPTELVGQNGAVLHETTKIAVTGCSKVKALTRAQKLAAALKNCHKDKHHAKRRKCEKEARAKYGPAKKKPTKTKKK